MSRLESNEQQRFTIIENEEIAPKSLNALPLKLRKEALENFDREFRLDDLKRKTRSEEISIENSYAAKISSETAEYLANAKHLFKEKEFELAEQMYKSILKLEPNNQIAIRGLSDCAKVLAKHEEAIHILNKLVAVNPSFENYKTLGDQLYQMEYNEDAIAAYLHALRFEDLPADEHFEILKNFGNILLRIGDTNGAEEYYNKAYTLFPDSDVLLVNFGSLAIYRNEFDKAVQRFREAASLNPKNDKAWTGLAMIHREYGDCELAWANVEKALDCNPYNESAIKLVADWALKDNEIDKAITRLTTYLNENPEDALIHMWLAKFYFFAGHLLLAQGSIEAALRIEPLLDGGQDILKIIRDEKRSRGLK